jgi:hypothetical protein
MPNTTKFNWPTPADTDLVKDGAEAIRDLGNAIDTTISGTVLRILSTTKTDTFSTASTSYVDVTDLDVTITPISTSSKIYVVCSLSLQYSDSATDRAGVGTIFRDSTNLSVPASLGTRRAGMTGINQRTAERANVIQTMTFLDSPNTTSAITYKAAVVRAAAAGTVYVNRAQDDTDSTTHQRYISTITVMEVAE